MKEENILEVIIDLGNSRVDFNIKTDFIAEDFSDDRLEKDVKIIETIKERLLIETTKERLLIECLNEDQVSRIIIKEFQTIIPKLNLKWKITFKIKIE